jgi:squalene synthase HpnC
VVVSEAYASCERAARAHYENFPVASLLVPQRMRPHVAAVYAFARAADDFADEGSCADAERLELLDGWEIRLHRAAESPEAGPAPRRGEPSNAVEIFIALGESIRSLSLSVRLFEDLLSAFRQDVTVKRYRTWDHVMDYCRRSANPVGRLVLRIAGYHDARLDGWSDAMCAALQLTNFWQDLKIDFDRGQIWLQIESRQGGSGPLEVRRRVPGCFLTRDARCVTVSTAVCATSFGRRGLAACGSWIGSSGRDSM